jgi:hypothetical protein
VIDYGEVALLGEPVYPTVGIEKNIADQDIYLR